jgi:hypothetical protein
MSRYAFYDVLGRILVITEMEPDDNLPEPKAHDYHGAAGVVIVADNIDPSTHYFKIDSARKSWALQRRPVLPLTVNDDTVTVPAHSEVSYEGLSQPIHIGDKESDVQVDDLANGESVEVTVKAWPYLDRTVTLYKPPPGKAHTHGSAPVSTIVHHNTVTEH